MRRHDKPVSQRPRRRSGIYARRRSLVPPIVESRRFEVQQRDDVGPVRRMLFATERDALTFADMLAHWMARRGESGSVQILWPAARASSAAD